MEIEHSSVRNTLDHERAHKASTSSWLGSTGRLLLALVLLAGAGGISVYWLTHRPAAQRRPPQPQAVLVEVSPIRPQPEQIVVHALGTVVPAKSIELISRVSGQIVEVNPHFVPGGRFQANDHILQVEQEDYRLAVRQRESDLVKAQRDLKLEMGQQSVAQSEYELLEQEVQEEDMELLLRKPQLEMAEAAVSAAEASLEQARLDLQRTTVVAPFNAMVQSRDVDLGSQVNIGTVLASLVGTDEYWVEVSVPVSELRWIKIPGHSNENGSSVHIFYESAWGKDMFRTGSVERLLSDLEPQGRMARLLVSVQDPLQLSAASEVRHPLILGSYVRVEIEGEEVADVAKIPRTALREGDLVWLMGPDDNLVIRKVDIIWSSTDHVYVRDGLSEGDLLVTSNIGAPVQGMALRTAISVPASPNVRIEEIPEARPEPES